MRSSIGLIDRPPRHGSQCHTGMGTTTVGMPRDVSVSAMALKSLAPDKKPGTMTAALIRGSKPVATVAWHSNDANRRRAMPPAVGSMSECLCACVAPKVRYVPGKFVEGVKRETGISSPRN